MMRFGKMSSTSELSIESKPPVSEDCQAGARNTADSVCRIEFHCPCWRFPAVLVALHTADGRRLSKRTHAYLTNTIDEATYNAKSAELTSDSLKAEEEIEKLNGVRTPDADLGVKLFD